jgi:hypothetical protein
MLWVVEASSNRSLFPRRTAISTCTLDRTHLLRYSSLGVITPPHEVRYLPGTRIRPDLPQAQRRALGDGTVILTYHRIDLIHLQPPQHGHLARMMPELYPGPVHPV